MRQTAHLLSVLVMLAMLSACYSGSRPAGIDKPAPDFTVTDSDHSVSLHNLRGKTVVLNFWATWCPPCVEEMPSLVAMQQKLKDRVTVVAVSVDVDGDAYHHFLKSNHVNLLTVRDADQASNNLYGTYKFPETYIIDREGKVRRKLIGPVDWNDSELQEYLKGL